MIVPNPGDFGLYQRGFNDGYKRALKELLGRIGVLHPGLMDSVVAVEAKEMLDQREKETNVCDNAAASGNETV